MEHLVQDHLYGNYYISDADPDFIEETCENCGDCDWIILSYQEGNKFNALTNYFKGIKNSKKYLIDSYINGVTREDLLDYVIYEYDEDKEMINGLLEDNIITKEEKTKLLRIVYYYKKRQLKLLKAIKFDEVLESPKKMVYKKN